MRILTRHIANGRLSRSSIVLGLLVAVFLAAAASPPSDTSDTSVISNKDAEADAIRFRTSFGLDAGDDFVRETFDDPRYSTDAYGVPLSQSEVDELLRRAWVETRLDQGAHEFAARQPGFAGVQLDQQRGGRPIFRFTQEPSTEVVETLASMLPDDANLEVLAATRTLAELQELKALVEAERLEWGDAGIDVVRVSYRPSLNAVRIGIHEWSREAEARLQGRYGASTIVYEAPPAHADSCGPTSCWPMKGGIGIYATGNNPAAPDCTSGFVVKRTDTGVLGMLTAGHCLDYHGPEGHGWRHDGTAFGPALKDTWVNGGQSNADVGLIWIQSGPASQMTQKNQMRRTASSIANVNAYQIGVVEGTQACRMGWKSLHDCGVVQDPDVGHSSPVQGWGAMWVVHTAEINIDSQGGDSGGSVFKYPGGGTCCSPVTALGTHIHSQDPPDEDLSWFSPYWIGRAAYDAIPGVTYTYQICLNATCT